VSCCDRHTQRERELYTALKYVDGRLANIEEYLHDVRRSLTWLLLENKPPEEK
jgi:hypothetical protein